MWKNLVCQKAHGQNIYIHYLDAEDHKPDSPLLKTGRNQGEYFAVTLLSMRG